MLPSAIQRQGVGDDATGATSVLAGVAALLATAGEGATTDCEVVAAGAGAPLAASTVKVCDGMVATFFCPLCTSNQVSVISGMVNLPACCGMIAKPRSLWPVSHSPSSC